MPLGQEVQYGDIESALVIYTQSSVVPMLVVRADDARCNPNAFAAVLLASASHRVAN